MAPNSAVKRLLAHEVTLLGLPDQVMTERHWWDTLPLTRSNTRSRVLQGPLASTLAYSFLEKITLLNRGHIPTPIGRISDENPDLSRVTLVYSRIVSLIYILWGF